MKNINLKKLSNGGLILIFIYGLSIAKDFGISWDEAHHRDSGKRIAAYLINFFGLEINKPIPQGLKDFDYMQKKYGPIFDTISAVVEEVFQLKDMKNIFIMRHYLNFIFYFAGYLGYFYFLKLIFPKNNYALILSFFYLFHPRLFGQGFFNPKDSVLQAYVSISLIPIVRSFLYFKTKDLVLSGVALGIAISTKVVCVYLPFLFSFFYLLISYLEKTNVKTILKNLSLFYVLLVFFIFIFWPPWTNPLKSVIDMFIVLKQYPIPGENFLMGEYVSRFNLPWYYIPLWIGITTPLTFIIFFFIGLYENFKKFFKKITKKSCIDSFMLAGFLVPISSVIFFGSTLYGGWRHMFFIYPFLVYFMIKGFIGFIDWIASNSKLKKERIILILSIIVFTAPMFSIVKIHPNQPVYFNILAGKDPMLLFEGDAWGISYRQGLEWIIENDNRDSIMVSIHNSPGSRNRHMLPNTERKRLHFQFISEPGDLDEIPGDYFITNFYGEQRKLYFKAKKSIPPFDKESFSVNVGEMKILGLYKLDN